MNVRTAKTIFLLLAAFTVLAFAGCGESKEEKALASVCESKADIEKQVNTLKGVTLSTGAADTVQTSVKAIGDDLKNIQDQIPTLKDSVKPQVQAANDSFKSQLAPIALQLAKSLAVGDASAKADASAQVEQALTDLAAAYQTAFSSLECPAS